MNVAISGLNINLSGLGGLQNRLRYLIRGLLDADITVNIIQTKSSFDASEEFYNNVDRKQYLKPILIPDVWNIKSPWSFLRLHAIRIQNKLRNNEIDILDTYDPYLYLSKIDHPVIYTTNFFIDYVKELFEIHEIRYAYMHLLKCLIEGRVINRADHFIIQNSIQKRRLVEYYDIPEDTISIIPTGFDDKIVEDVKKQPILEHSENIIAYSGRLSIYKGVFELINAFTEISKTNSKWNLWLIGDGPDRSSLETLVKSRGLSDRVKFLGPQNMLDTIKYTNQCKIFVFPSYIESIPSSVLEAMALGKPVVASDVGPIGIDLINDNCGVLVPPKDSKALTDSLKELIDNEKLRRVLGGSAEVKVRNITREKMIEKTIDIYEKMVTQ